MTDILRRRLCVSLPAALALPSLATAATTGLRIATLAPRGSLYHRALLEMGEALRRAEGPGTGFTVFTDGVQGDEIDVVRRMRIGQINGALITVVGLNTIEPGAAALQFMPLMFRSWEEVDAAAAKLRPVLEQRIAERGFQVLFWAEAGWVRFFSRSAAMRPGDLRRMKIFSWSGSPAHIELMRALGYQPVALETADILPGLQTGLIDAVPVVANWALAAQLDTLAPHMLDLRWVPIVGAAVVTRKAWDALSPAGQAALREAARTAAAKLRAVRESADQEAVQAMVKRGLTVHTPSEEARQEWEALAAKAWPTVRGNLVPADTFDAVQQALAGFRSGRG